MSATISKVLLIGMPETALNFIFSLLIWEGREWIKEKNNILKILLLSIIFSFLAFNIKDYLNHRIILQMVPLTIILTIFIKEFWKTNKRCALLMSSMSIFLVFISEIATMQLMAGQIEDIIKSHGFLHIKALIIWTTPTRIIQLITVLVIYKYNLTFKNNKLLYEDWNKLSASQKETIYSLFTHFFVSITISAGYIEIFIKAMNEKMNIDFIKFPLLIMLFGSLYIIFSTLKILFKQTLLEDLKGVLFQGPSKLFKNMLEASDEKQILDYKLQLDNKMKELFEREEENQ